MIRSTTLDRLLCTFAELHCTLAAVCKVMAAKECWIGLCSITNCETLIRSGSFGGTNSNVPGTLARCQYSSGHGSHYTRLRSSWFATLPIALVNLPGPFGFGPGKGPYLQQAIQTDKQASYQEASFPAAT